MSTENPSPEQLLAEIRERHSNATEGPWWFDESENCWRLHGVMGRIPPLSRDGFIPEQVMNKQILKAAKNGTPYAEYWPDKADGAFISHAWEDVRDLLAEVKRLRAGIVALDRLDRAVTGDWEREVDRLKAEFAEMGSAVARARALHAEISHRPGYCYCANPYPCPTIRALDPDGEGGESRG